MLRWKWASTPILSGNTFFLQMSKAWVISRTQSPFLSKVTELFWMPCFRRKVWKWGRQELVWNFLYPCDKNKWQNNNMNNGNRSRRATLFEVWISFTLLVENNFSISWLWLCLWATRVLINENQQVQCFATRFHVNIVSVVS